jgi:hypothetical protein
MSTWACTPRSSSRALFFACVLALLLVFVYSVPAFANDLIVNDDAGCNDATGSPSYCHIQAAIDIAAAGDTIKVYPGSYNETAAGRQIYNNTGPYQFGLFINKALTIQGVDAGGAPITAASAAAALVTTNATNNFGPSSVWVEGDGVTISGLVVGPNTAGENKTFEVLGDAFALKYSRIAVPGGGSVYLNDERFDTASNVSHLKSYTIEGNRFEQGASLDLTNGAGYSGPVSGRLIKNNQFIYGATDYWAAISFSGSDTGVEWFIHSVGGAVITDNTFSGGQQFIRARGTYDNAQFDWQAYWNDNTFDRAAVTLVGGASTFDVRTYAYVSGSYNFNNVRRIGGLIQPEVGTAQPGDTIQLTKGLFVENVTLSKHVKLLGAGSGSDPTANTVLRLPNNAVPIESVVTLTGSGVSDADPLLLKALRIEPRGEVGISLGIVGNWNAVQSVSYLRFEDVQVVGTPGQSHIENERCLDLELNKSVAHLIVVNSGFSQCDHGWYFNKHNGAITPSTAQYIAVYNSSFIDNSYKGMYIELLSDAIFDNVVVSGNGLIANWNGAFNAGVDINLKAGAYQNLVFRNMTVTGNGLGAQHGAGLLVKARDDGATYGANPATLTNVLIEGGVFSGNERGIRIGEPGTNNASPTNVQIHNASITGNNPTYTGANPSASGGLVNNSIAAVNAEYNWWGSATGPTEAGNPGGTGERVTNANTGSVDYTPWLGYAPPLALYIPGSPIDLPTGATSFTLPVKTNASDFSSTAFSLDYDTACLSINPTDANGDDVVDAITGIPGGFVGTVKLDTADADGELDVAMWDPTAPLAYMPNGDILLIQFSILPACQGPLDHTTYVKFSGDPAPSFSDVNGNAVTRTTQNADPLLLDFNQAATAINLSANTVAENAPAGTVVGALSTNDADGGAPIYTLASGCSPAAADNASFAITGATLSTGVVFDYETGVPAKTICVEVNDGQGGVFKQSLTVNVTNINEPPTSFTLSNNEVAEGAAVGTLVGTFSTSGDPEGATTFTYAFAPGDGAADNAKFAIAGSQLKTAAAVDYSVQSVYYIRVSSTDPGGAVIEKQFVINVLDHSLLSIGDTFVVRHNQAIGIPVVFTANGNTPAYASFSIAYNAACLTYVSTSGGAGNAAGGVVTVNPNGPFVNGTLATITFSANPACTSGTSVPLNFTAASLNGGALPVDTDNGKVLVISNSARGDCNSDGAVNAGDFSAIVLETFDDDLPWWLEAPKSTFPGSPVGCDANASEYIDVADVVCTVLVVFGNSACTNGSLLAANAADAAEPALLAVGSTVEGQAISAAVTLDTQGADVAGAAFTLVYDPAQATLDMSDGDGDGIPDAISFATGSSLKRSVSVDAANGRIKIAVYGLNLPLPTLADGVIANVRLQAQGDAALAGLGLADAALGNTSGGNTPVEVTVNGAASQLRWLYLPAINN